MAFFPLGGWYEHELTAVLHCYKPRTPFNTLIRAITNTQYTPLDYFYVHRELFFHPAFALISLPLAPKDVFLLSRWHKPKDVSSIWGAYNSPLGDFAILLQGLRRSLGVPSPSCFKASRAKVGSDKTSWRDEMDETAASVGEMFRSELVGSKVSAMF